MLGRGDDDGVEGLQLQELLGNEKGAWCGAVCFLIGSDSALSVNGPEVADSGHLNVLRLAQLRDHAIELRAGAADADVPDGDAVVGAGDAAVGERAGTGRRRSGREQGALLEKFAATDLIFRWAHVVLALSFLK